MLTKRSGLAHGQDQAPPQHDKFKSKQREANSLDDWGTGHLRPANRPSFLDCLRPSASSVDEPTLRRQRLSACMCRDRGATPSGSGSGSRLGPLPPPRCPWPFPSPSKFQYDGQAGHVANAKESAGMWTRAGGKGERGSSMTSHLISPRDISRIQRTSVLVHPANATAAGPASHPTSTTAARALIEPSVAL
ncbi:hypothetical protein CDD83_9642 [Cordyceps sp. RAO-2017]|nr:hypothetical protein CDD83_9642 [Cordyceps sp. RAO-2017]